LAAGWWR